MRIKHRVLLGAVLAALAGCVGSSGIPVASVPNAPHEVARSTASPIQHLVILIQENRSFDNLFATFPGANGTMKGLMRQDNGAVVTVPLTKGPLLSRDIQHIHATFVTEYDKKKMDGFGQAPFAGGGGKTETYIYRYVDPKQIAPYWALAKQYVLADRLFQTQSSGSFTAHLDLIRGSTKISSKASIVDLTSADPAGCDAPDGTKTQLIYRTGKVVHGVGPFPCFNWVTIRDLLDAKGVSWKYYVPPIDGHDGGPIWNAFDAIRPVRYSAEWGTNVSMPETNVFADLSSGKLPAVSWLVPSVHNSDHPGAGPDDGPSWVAQVVNAIGHSPYWKSTAVVVLWDDWGGQYDHVAPPQLDYQGLGFRVPMLVISPYVPKGRVSHTQYEFGSILRFIEDNWGLGRLNTTDVRANSIDDAFNFAQKPRRFQTIPATKSLEFFLHQPISDEPVDTE